MCANSGKALESRSGEQWILVWTGSLVGRKFPHRLGRCFSKFVPGSAALASLGSLLEVQTLRPTPDLLNQNQNPHLNKIPR